MLRILKQLIHPNAASRKILAGLGAVLLLFALFFSSLFVAVEADHECSGSDCSICLDLQNCVNGFQQTGTPVVQGEIVPAVPAFHPEMIGAHTVRVPAPTLHSLHVRLNE